MRLNIYEIPKVHPFIKTLEKVKELWDNLDEHIEITSQLWEDSKSSDAYYDRNYPERHWRDHLLELLFDEDQIAKHTNFEYDAKINGTHILSYLDSDLCRLNRFREALISLGNTTEKYEVLCFEWQYDFVKKFLGDLAKVTVISFDAVDKEMSEYYRRYLIN